MKILVFSDSHGDTASMMEAVLAEKPDHMLHLGDVTRDAEALERQFPKIGLDYVSGNCDFCTRVPPTKLLELEGRRALVTHGHPYQVKSGLGPAISAARSAGAGLLLFGHTHRAYAERLEDGLWVMNPGSCQSRGRGSYGVIMLEKKDMVCYTVPI